ncbi:MAG: GIY-YIG nuclease family protein [Gammaproteobacteria bacterium]|nr:MAG: GIY-YIG nuclease family protein [Gammaproteobacteria bacterium]
MLRCVDGSLYTGMTNNLQRRLQAHASGRGSRYTRSRLPVELVWHRHCSSRSEALRLEARIKRMKASAKRTLAESIDEH